ncbi:hypothetical protein DFH11DRAFT_1731764 [Phellopilus nigrolimitatus]|nr:hypothetical protein DFH11DRAFT_1731764 [Phellopilus nigrolimitatus]
MCHSRSLVKWLTLVGTTVATVGLGAQRVFVIDNGVAKLPAMGYSSAGTFHSGEYANSDASCHKAWNVYACDIDQDLLISTANLMQSLGLQDARHTHVNIDDCGAEKNCSTAGDLIPVPFSLFSLRDHVIYATADTSASAQELYVPASSLFNFKEPNNPNPVQHGDPCDYERMADAITDLATSSGQLPIIFFLWVWGWSQVWIWGKQFVHSWRTMGDIGPNWPALASIINLLVFSICYSQVKG